MSVDTKAKEKEGLKAGRAQPRHYTVSLVALGIAVIASILWHNAATSSIHFFGHSITPAKDAYDFRLINQEGAQTRLSDWRGQVVLFCFGFTHCPNVCPTTLTNLVDVLRALQGSERGRVRIAFISVDPQRDTPAYLKNYLGYFDPSIVGLSGSKDEIDRTTGAFGASYAFIGNAGNAAGTYSVMHSTNVYLVNPKGEWELIYDFQQLQEPAKVAADIDNALHR
ncbi:MAG: SCO family protein [Verrucomicrobia bacterium]|nr:SCO family protein [Verrucomicrobiota bacterium]